MSAVGLFVGCKWSPGSADEGRHTTQPHADPRGIHKVCIIRTEFVNLKQEFQLLGFLFI